MKLRPYSTLLLFSLLTLTFLAGCADSLVNQAEEVNTGARPSAKLRHAHLFADAGAGKLLERYEVLATHTEFVVGATSISLKLLERYSSEEGVTIKHTYTRVFQGFAMHVDSVHVPRVLRLMDGDDQIIWVEPDVKLKNGKPQSSDFKGGNHQVLPWGVKYVGADVSSTKAGDGKGAVKSVEIYILDSGIKEHDVNVVQQIDFSQSGSAADKLGHGTHVAGTAAAIDNTHGIVGVAPGAQVYNYKVLNDDGRSALSTVIAAVEQITERKLANPSVPMVVNISLGGKVGTTAYNSLDEAIAASIRAGVVYVVAAGNAQKDASLFTPAHVTEAITVGAHDRLGAFASFSNFGPVVDLLAPGVDIESLQNSIGAKMPPVLMSGTSMAAPHVTGAAALYLSRNPRATPAQVENALKSTALAQIQGAPAGTTNLSVYVGSF